MKKLILATCAGALLCLPIPAVEADESSQEPSFGPVIEGYGPTYPIDDRDVPLEDGAVYRVAFDLANYPGGPDAVNRTLVSVARFLNMHGRNGVAVENMHIAVVAHGAALKSLLSNAAYRSRYEVDNPNLELIGKLDAAGVEFYVCGQSMMFGGIDKDEFVDPARVALSAMTMLTVLQSQDYALLPW